MFVCFEGIDGAGKSTQARLFCERMRLEKRRVELVADPGTTSIGTAIRQILLHNDAPISTVAQMLLFSAARAELASYIREKMASGVTIVCDRWLLSTLVYQGEINGIDPDLILGIFHSTSNIVPDLCFLLDIPPEAAAERMGAPRDRYERRSLADRERMRKAYHKYATCPSVAKCVFVVDAEKQIDTTHAEIYRLYDRHRIASEVEATV